MKNILRVLAIAALAWFVYSRVNVRPNPPTKEAARSGLVAESGLVAPDTDSSFSCDGRTHCSQMTSCEEAEFFLQNCPDVQMDGNGDGEPCEGQWCGNSR